MLYTDNYELNLPQTSDAVRVEDINENTRSIDGLLAGMELTDLTAAEIWGGNNIPSEVTISGAFSKLAQSVPATVGTVGTLLTAGSIGASWGRNMYYAELISEVTVNRSGDLTSLAGLPTGWSVENLRGMIIEGELDWVGRHNNYVDYSISQPLMCNSVELTDDIYFYTAYSYDSDATNKTTFCTTFHCVALDDNDLTLSAPNDAGDGIYFTVTDGVVTGTGGYRPYVGFYYYASDKMRPSTDSITGTVRFYALREVN